MLSHMGMFSGFYLGLSGRYSVILHASMADNFKSWRDVFWVLPGTKLRIYTPGILANNFKSWRDVFWILPGTKQEI